MISDDTIAAIATPLGEGGIGIVRLSGTDAVALAAQLVHSPDTLRRADSHTVHRARLRAGQTPIDDVLITVFKAPHSYTGENVVEISCHGGVFLLKRVLEICLQAGARQAAPGEFTRRAFLNGKMDLAQAEAVADLIAAHSETARRLALDQLRGELSREIGRWHQDLVDLLAHLEAGLDFTEDDIPALPEGEARSRLDRLIAETQRAYATAARGRLYRDGLRVVLIGKPNVGKSSLFNAFLKYERAIVTEIPGTTRDTLEERFLCDDVPMILTDTAGFRPHSGPVETEGIARAKQALESAAVALCVLDSTTPPSDEDRGIARQLKGKKTVLALNKSDLPTDDRERIRKAHGALFSGDSGEPPAIFTSALTGAGLSELGRALVSVGIAGASLHAEAAPGPVITNARHAQLLKETIDSLEAARRAVDTKAPAECLALELKQSLDRLGLITGNGVGEDVMDAIFSKFCVGK